LELRDYLQFVRRRWLVILSSTLLVVLVAGILTSLQTPLYASTSRLFVSTPQSKSSAAFQGSLFSAQRVASYADLLKSLTVAQRVVDKLGLDESAASLASQVSASVVPDTVIITMSVTDPSPGRAQRVARAVADEFTNLVQELEKPEGKKRAPISATVVDPASYPTTTVSPKPRRNLAVGAILGLLIGLVVGRAVDSSDRTARSASDVADATGCPVVGRVRHSSRSFVRAHAKGSALQARDAEAFRMLRTGLRYADVDHPPKTLVVTSATPGEGKTMTAINLALTFAQTNERVLLMEADLRWPRIAAYLDIEANAGLTDVLAGYMNPWDAIITHKVDDHQLEVLPSGPLPPNPSELLQSAVMVDLLATLHAVYDVIVIDTPAMLRVTDAALVAAEADGVLLLVRLGKPSREQLAEAASQLRAVDAHLIGTVLHAPRSDDTIDVDS